jgi:glycogen debranching enzyme
MVRAVQQVQEHMIRPNGPDIGALVGADWGRCPSARRVERQVTDRDSGKEVADMTDHRRVGPLSEITCVLGESFAVSGPDGDIQVGGDQGVYVRDTRFVNRLELTVDGAPPRPLAGRAVAASRAVFHAFVPSSDDQAVDPTLLVTRHRVVDGSLHEEVILENRGPTARNVRVELHCGSDFAYIFDVKHARTLPGAVPVGKGDRLVFEREGGTERVVLHGVNGTSGAIAEDDRLRWDVQVPARGVVRCCVDIEVADVYGEQRPRRGCEVFPGEVPRSRGAPSVEFQCSDARMTRLVRRSLQDLTSLQLPDPANPSDRFCAAGSPWYLTLFGRDALWAAMMALPHDLSLAGGTLRTLARRQGQRLDAETEEAPGKILHEIRRGSLAHRGDLPPNYYGTIDATPLFVVLLHEAWRWGLPEREVEALLPNLEAALTWMVDFGDPNADGLLEYVKQGRRGLDNQGWKDSHDGIQFADGRLPDPPIALAEVQGYAFDAARRGAELLDHFGRPGGQTWRNYAEQLRQRFHERFWVEDATGPYLAVALDGHGRAVDAPASNMGHVLSSGLLDAEQASTIARRLAGPELNSGWGLRTMATDTAGYNPLAYHCGSVWPHDTAIAVWGCALAGEREPATALLRGLVAAAPYFRSRLPELFAGMPRALGDFPVPYPTACRPQAWAAAGSLFLLRACLRPRPNIPEGQLTLAPLWPPPFRRLTLRGLPIAGGYLDLRLDADDGVEHELRETELELTWDLGSAASRPF